MPAFTTLFTDDQSAAFFAIYLPAVCASMLVALLFSDTRRSASGGLTKHSKLDHFFGACWNRFVRVAAHSKITPNQISWTGLLLVCVNAGLYLYHQNSFGLGVGLILSFLLDALDGVVARAQGSATKFGGFLDAFIDRCQEIVTLFAIGEVTGWWALSFLAITGSLLTSYAKARVAIETPVDNKGWPELMSRYRRLWVLGFGLLGDACMPWVLQFCLFCLGVMSYYTAYQRYIHARVILDQLDSRRDIYVDGSL